MLYYAHYPEQEAITMSSRSKRKKDIKQLFVRIVSLALAVLMVLSVVMAYVWRW